jgi:nucleoside-diphosphate-sugar epimerase
MNTTNKTILIGPTGFLGPAFLEKDPSIIAVGRDYLKLPEHLNNEFFYIESDASFAQLNDLDFQNVIFLIGCSDHHKLNIHPTLAIEKNVLALSRFLWYLKQSKRKVNKIINFTTMLQYDTSKIIDVRISNVYGPTRLLRPDIVPSTIWSLIHNKSASVWTKKPKRDFIYVEDAIDAVLKLIESDFSGSVNLGTGIGSTVGELCECLEELSNIKITDQNIKVPGHMEFYQDISLLKSIIDWEPKYSLKDGLTKTYQKMKEYYKEKEVINRLGNLNKN